MISLLTEHLMIILESQPHKLVTLEFNCGCLGESTVTIGTSEVANLGANGQIRYGNRNMDLHIVPESLDFLNYGDGNINYYLQAGNAGIDTGAFHCITRWQNVISYL